VGRAQCTGYVGLDGVVVARADEAATAHGPRRHRAPVTRRCPDAVLDAVRVRRRTRLLGAGLDRKSHRYLASQLRKRLVLVRAGTGNLLDFCYSKKIHNRYSFTADVERRTQTCCIS